MTPPLPRYTHVVGPRKRKWNQGQTQYPCSLYAYQPPSSDLSSSCYSSEQISLGNCSRFTKRHV